MEGSESRRRDKSCHLETPFSCLAEDSLDHFPGRIGGAETAAPGYAARLAPRSPIASPSRGESEDPNDCVTTIRHMLYSRITGRIRELSEAEFQSKDIPEAVWREFDPHLDEPPALQTTASQLRLPYQKQTPSSSCRLILFHPLPPSCRQMQLPRRHWRPVGVPLSSTPHTR